MCSGVRVLLVEAESKLMELKYPGARAGGASDKLGRQQPPAGKPWGQSARARDKRSLIEAYKHALFRDGMSVTREKQWS